MSRVKLYVGNIPYNADEESLRQAFASQGPAPVGVRLITDRDSGQPRGFAFVEMASAADAQAAIAALDGSNFGGRTMRVSLARERGSGEAPRGGAGAGGQGYGGGQAPYQGYDGGGRGHRDSGGRREDDDDGRSRRGRGRY